jgi:hypothetical protein
VLARSLLVRSDDLCSSSAGSRRVGALTLPARLLPQGPEDRARKTIRDRGCQAREAGDE